MVIDGGGRPRLRRYLALPAEVTPFEERYLRRVNRLALILLWAHLPAFALIAALAGTSVPLALVLTLVAVTGPTLAYVALAARPRAVSVVYGFATMVMGAVLVYVGKGQMQIEMHFYFLVLIALLSVFGNPMVIVTATVTVAVHHAAFWLIAPRVVFNYDAAFSAVAVHAVFVVLDAIAACFVARSFFDNVIGLERILAVRSADLDERNRAMALILDNVAQGFVTVRLDGSIASERSQALTEWFGVPAADARIWSYLLADDPDHSAWMELGFDSLVEGAMPAALVIDQLPRRLTRGDRQLRLEYRPIGEPLAALLVVVSDVTSELERQRAESAQRELIAVVERSQRDRAGVLAFIREADELIRECLIDPGMPLIELQRRIHTLKGNAALFGVVSVAAVCHELETEMQDEGGPPSAAARAQLAEAWRAFRGRLDGVLGLSARRTLSIDWDEYLAVVSALTEPEPPWARPIRRWGQDPTRAHLERFAEQARQLAARLAKAELDVEIYDHDLRLEGEQLAPLWSALIHTVRNAVDHGIEPTAARVASGKSARGLLVLTTEIRDDELVVEVRDDGAGIDWSRIATRARARGMAADSPGELREAVFAHGVSTAAEVAETSGRGVGLGALRAACVALGGQVDMESELGHGTTIRCRVPLPRTMSMSQRIPLHSHASWPNQHADAVRDHG